MFERQKTYTREQIHAALGGDTWSYLPESCERVVAGRFRTIINPGVRAPRRPHTRAPQSTIGRTDAIITSGRC